MDIRIFMTVSLGALALAACGRSSKAVKAEEAAPAATAAEQAEPADVGSGAAYRAQLGAAVGEDCGWKSPPEVGGFVVGMSLEEVRAVALSNKFDLTCKDSAPLDLTTNEGFQAALHDEFAAERSSDDDKRAWTTCETKVDGNGIKLMLFRLKGGDQAYLGKAVNFLSSFERDTPLNTVTAVQPARKALSTKFGLDINAGARCQITGRDGRPADLNILYIEPFADRTPEQPNLTLNFQVYDQSIVDEGGLVTKARDLAASAAEEKRKEEAAGKIRY